jgi:hypothetical protein
MTKEQMKEWIDNASYEELLAKWRFSPVGDPFFQGEVGDYFTKKIITKRATNPEEHTRVSKKLGW